ncbi:MAG: site-specific integrase, partial [Thermoplasmata archaeon]|nr:site-specific integrase [Candidatus Sysuiplasma acidicola]
MPAESKYAILLEDDRVRRWYEELRARSVITAGVYLRGLGYYCEHNHTSPSVILEGAVDARTFKDTFRDFVRKLEKEGKAGSYI